MKPIYRTLLLCLLIFTSTNTLLHSQSIDSIFVNMPLHLNPLLTKAAKLQLLDNFKKNNKDNVQNTFGGNSAIIQYDSLNCSIKIQNTAISTMDIFTFRTSTGESKIGIISTTGDSLQNSEIRFFNPDWSGTDIKFEKPTIVDWLNTDELSPTGTTLNWIFEQVPVPFISLSYDPVQKQLIASHNFLKFVSNEMKNFVEPYFRNEPLKLIFQYDKWVKVQ